MEKPEIIAPDAKNCLEKKYEFNLDMPNFLEY
jgi:hypothetical protein